MKILHVIQKYWPSTGGSERHLQEISERLARRGHQVTVFTTDALDLELFWNPRKERIATPVETHNGVEIRRFPVRHLAGNRLAFGGIRRAMAALAELPVDASAALGYLARFVPWVPSLRRALDDLDDDYAVVHGMNVCFESLLLPALAFARRRGIPFVITPLIHLGESERSIVRRFYTMPHQIRLVTEADAVLAQTSIEIDYLIARGIDPRRIVLAGVGVNPEDVLGGVGQRFRDGHGLGDGQWSKAPGSRASCPPPAAPGGQDARAPGRPLPGAASDLHATGQVSGAPVGGPLVAYIGTSAYDKGTVHLVEAMRQLWDEPAHACAADLVLAGPVFDQFRAYLNGLPARHRGRVHLLGFVDEQVKRDLLDAAAVIAMPSRTDSFGIVYLEGWLYRKPVIGARAGGVPAVVDDQVDGYLVDFGDVAGLARRIQDLLDQPDLARAMGERGSAKVLERYTWDRIYPVVEEVYERLCPRATVS